MHIIILFYFISRLINLTLLPPFNDESSYLDWGWRAIHLGVPWHSLYDAKQPLLIWTYGLTETVISDPLLAGRLISVLTGLAALLGIYFVAKFIFNEKVALFSSLSYLMSPLLFLFDRQALFESAITAMGIWSVYFFLKLTGKPVLKYSLFLGVIFALGFWIKTSSLLFIIPVYFYYLLFSLRSTQKPWHLSLAIYLLVTTLFLLSPLLFQTQFWSTFLKTNSQYSLSISELLHFPLLKWGGNLLAHLEIAFFQLSPSIFILAVIGIVLSLRTKSRHNLLLLLLLLSPFILETLSVRTVSPRYLAPFLIFIPLYTGLALSRFPWFSVSLLLPAAMLALLTFNPPLYFQTLAKFTKHSATEVYICCSFTGYPTRAALDYIKTLPQSGQSIFVGSFLNPGNPPSALFAYFRRHPLIKTGYLDSQMFSEKLSEFDCIESDIPLYYLGQNHYQAGFNKFLTPVKEFPNPFGSEESVTLYTTKSDCTGLTLPLTFTH